MHARLSAVIYFPGVPATFVVLFVAVFASLIFAHYWFDEVSEKRKRSITALALLGTLAFATYPLTGNLPLTLIGFALATAALFDVLARKPN